MKVALDAIAEAGKKDRATIRDAIFGDAELQRRARHVELHRHG